MEPSACSPTTFFDLLPDPNTDDGWAVEELRQKSKFQDNGTHVAEAIQQGTCKAVCDGSYKNTHGTASFCLHGEDPNFQLMGSNHTPGIQAEQSPFRSEMGGVVGVLTTLKALCDFHNVSEGSVELGLDCQGAIN